MSYSYLDERPYVFTDEGQVQLFAIIRMARQCLEFAGAVRCDKLCEAAKGTPDSWKRLALVDRLVEMRMLRLVSDRGAVTQHQIYVAGETPL